VTESDEEDRLWNTAWNTFERWYEHVVTGYADSATDEKNRRIEEAMGEDEDLDEEDAEEETREDFDQWLHETLDGAAELIYTNQAKVVLLISRNEDAYVNDFGEAAPTVEAAAFWALRTDVIEGM
jgi:hypothetical protein